MDLYTTESYKIFLFLGILLIIPLVSSVYTIQTLGTFQVNTCIDLKQVCGNCTFNNITSIILPAGTSIIYSPEYSMTRRNTDYNASFCNTSAIGSYIVNGYGNLNGANTVWAYDFLISPNGVSQTTSQGLGSFSFSFIMFGLTVLIGYLGFKLSESKTLWILGLFFLFLALLFVVYDVYLGYQYYLNYTGEIDAGMPQQIFYIFMFLLTAGFLVSIALLFLRWKDIGRYIKQTLKSKDDDEEFDRDLENS